MNSSSSRNYCCETMKKNVEAVCEMHQNPFDCADNLIYYSEQFNEYGLVVHDGGSSYVVISFCPFCGEKLPEWERKDD